jgi:hypothetical protein
VANHLQRSLSAYRTAPTLFSREWHSTNATAVLAEDWLGSSPDGSISDTPPCAFVNISLNSFLNDYLIFFLFNVY